MYTLTGDSHCQFLNEKVSWHRVDAKTTTEGLGFSSDSAKDQI